MGRPFKQELANLPENIAFALEHPIIALRDAIAIARAGQIYNCGAGGSYSAAAFAQLLFQGSKHEAPAITPLQFLQAPRPPEPATLLLFTASGRNKDILRVIDHAGNQNVRVLLICATRNSPAAKRAGQTAANDVFDFSYPARRDGFLAMNSLAVTWWLLARAFGFNPPTEKIAQSCAKEEYSVDFIARDRKHACTILYDRWTRPVAIDLESKMTEAALCAPLLSDWRQFGHGRHHWLAKNASFSSVVTLETPEAHSLATKSRALLPPSIPQISLASKATGPEGTCHLLLKSFALIGAIGRRVGIDPGRPGVPPFGSAFYHLAPPRSFRTRQAGAWDVSLAVERKVDAIGQRDEHAPVRRLVLHAANHYLTKISRVKFAAVVVDFDGTAAASGIKPGIALPDGVATALIRLLRAGVVVGIATGRGDSCHSNLAKTFPSPLRSRIFVSHYNGASIGNLSDLLTATPIWQPDQALTQIARELEADPLFSSLAKIQFKGVQITFSPRIRGETPIVEHLLRTKIGSRYSRVARVVASSHTIDVIPFAATKLKLIQFLGHRLGNAPILTLGDRGDLTGNDFDLLSTAQSLSVDRVSSDLGSCWNFLPGGVSHHDGTALYLAHAKIQQGRFQLRPK
jgi:hydroxymethylpyrimidine pyrophosphatase-like HAD family hydrolase